MARACGQRSGACDIPTSLRPSRIFQAEYYVEQPDGVSRAVLREPQELRLIKP